MPTKRTLEKLPVAALAALCGQVANDASLDQATRDKAAQLKLQWQSLVSRQSAPQSSAKKQREIEAKIAKLKKPMVALLTSV